MAGEKIGKLFEGIVMSALADLGYKPHWEVSVEQISIDPDITIGDSGKPTHWLLLTSSISAKNSLEKFWRNVGELFQVKRNLTRRPIVISIVLDSKQRDGLRTASDALFDSQILVGEAASKNGLGCTQLVEWVKGNADTMPTEKHAILAEVLSSIKADELFRRIYTEFRNKLAKVIKDTREQNTKLWALHSSNKTTAQYRRPKETYFRRGLGKLLSLGQPLASSLINSKSRTLDRNFIPEVYSELGFFDNSIKGLRLIDPEINWVIDNFENAFLSKIVKQCYSERKKNWDSWVAELQDQSDIDRIRFIQDNYTTLSHPKGLFETLMTLSQAESYKWLFAFIVELIKQSTGKKQGYGYGKISEDVGYTNGISQGYLLLSDWVNGHASNNDVSKLILDVSKALAKRLKDIGLPRAKGLLLKLRSELKSNLLEQKVLSYWLFEPLPILVESALAEASISFSRTRQYAHLISDLVHDGKTGYTHVIIAKATVVYWKSAYDLGKHHKTKELAGRISALRYRKNPNWSAAPGAKKFILVLDGTFNSEQVRCLITAGWDEIFYPDEMDKLAAAIV